MTDDDKTIYTSHKKPIYWLPKHVSTYMHKTVLIIGGSGSGKTITIEEVLYLLRDYVPNIIVFTPESSSKYYNDKVNPKCIKHDITAKRLLDIWNRQKQITEVYNIANNIMILESIFMIIYDRESGLLVNLLKGKAEEACNAIDASRLDFGQKKSQKIAIKEILEKQLTRIYKDSIRKNKDGIMKQKRDLSPVQLTAVEFLDLNPELVVVIDDLSEQFKGIVRSFSKTKDNPIAAIFFKCRHNHLTFVFGVHEEKYVDTELRKNAHLTIYADVASFTAAIAKESNGFNKLDRKDLTIYADCVFTAQKGIKNHKKFCVLRGDPHPYRYTIADAWPEFTIGCHPLKQLIHKMPSNEDKVLSNPYIKDTKKEVKHRF